MEKRRTEVKFFIWILLLILFVFGIWRSIFTSFTVIPENTQIQTPTPKPIGTTIQFNQQDFTAFYFSPHPSQTIDLIVNFDNNKPSAEIKLEYHCLSLINGGFYKKDNTPLGLLSVGDTVYSSVIRSNTFNGFFRKSGNSYYHDNAPISDWIVQSGPVLFFDGNPTKLAIKNDETARRSIVALNKTGSPIFISVISKDQANSGPLLADLPYVLEKINTIKNLNIEWAMNLDGGTASVFITKEVELSELKPVGSFFCIK